MTRVLYFHGLSANPGSYKAEALRRAGFDVLAPMLDYAQWDFAKTVATARASVEAHRPDVVVGSSLGGAVAMTLQQDGLARGEADRLTVLIAPAWDLGRVAIPDDLLEKKAGRWGALLAGTRGTLSPALALRAAEATGFNVPAQVGPFTLALHAHDDNVIAMAHTETLLRASPPAPTNSPVMALIARLRDLGYRAGGPDGLGDPRLITIGRRHACLEPADDCPANPGKSPLQCLVDIVREAGQMPPDPLAGRASGERI